jgi:hypothetical protein
MKLKNIRVAGAFFLGMIIGAIGLFAVSTIMVRSGYTRELTNLHKTFGDIEIWAQKPVVTEGDEVPVGFYQKVGKELWMTRDGAPFLLITKDVNDKISGLYLLKNKKESVLVLEPLEVPGKWGKAFYRNYRKGKPVGDIFIDLDFDGRFDFKAVVDSNGNRVSRSIFINNDWQIVNYFSREEMKAVAGKTKYLFDPNSGCWLEDRGASTSAGPA